MAAPTAATAAATSVMVAGSGTMMTESGPVPRPNTAVLPIFASVKPATPLKVNVALFLTRYLLLSTPLGLMSPPL